MTQPGGALQTPATLCPRPELLWQCPLTHGHSHENLGGFLEGICQYGKLNIFLCFKGFCAGRNNVHIAGNLNPRRARKASGKTDRKALGLIRGTDRGGNAQVCLSSLVCACVRACVPHRSQARRPTPRAPRASRRTTPTCTRKPRPSSVRSSRQVKKVRNRPGQAFPPSPILGTAPGASA